MTNLEYLSWFLEETYGAICFHNDKEDGFRAYSKDEEKEIETLAVYFPNLLDVENQEVRNRLEAVAGKNFYNRYSGAKGVRLSRLNGSVLIVRYMLDGKTESITVDAAAARLAGGVYNVIQYFIGEDISHIVFDRPNNFCQPIPTNNSFSINTGDKIQQKIEEYLFSCQKPLVAVQNGFYKAGKGSKWWDRERFLEEIERFSMIRQERLKMFFDLLKLMTPEDKKLFNSQMGLDAEPVKKSNIFDD